MNYKWNSNRPQDGELFQKFEEYIRDHQAIDVIKVTKAAALKLYQETKEILDIAVSNNRDLQTH
ncbi:hypothetical protein GCM10010912_67200 [Paenibacillus albidus]|uniref:Uncharacterized protein n=1 Tax=Paenibacillus albidus TaxID=2041023 RepID=A0A917D714_9BACL|nr:hypothetical protein GCM10010912_67200 [Paenibacillus albidus]